VRRARGALSSIGIDINFTPAAELARRIRAREVSPVEVVAASLARIEQVNPRLNCFCFVYPDEATTLAQEAERALESDRSTGFQSRSRT
jgi:Asp-tRNA(Asn)/Glu-tRNA(Gln) amidotransferase A subunit family amidase